MPKDNSGLESITNGMAPIDSLFEGISEPSSQGDAAVTDTDFNNDELIEGPPPFGADAPAVDAPPASTEADPVTPPVTPETPATPVPEIEPEPETPVHAEEPPATGNDPVEALALDSESDVTAEAVDAPDFTAIASNYDTELEASKERLAAKYHGDSVRIGTEYQQLQAQIKALRDGAVDEDPVSGEMRERSYLPSELDRRDALIEKLRANQAEAQRVMANFERDDANEKIHAYTNYIVGADKRLTPYKNSIIQMVSRGEIRPGADGQVDGEEVFLRAKYRHERSGGAPATANVVDVPVQRQATHTELQQAQQTRQQQAIKERGLGTISSGSGGGGGNTPSAKNAQPAYMQGASADEVKQIDHFDACLRGDA